MPNNLAIYIHYPFCKSKCPYCDFNSHVRNSIDFEEFEEGYLKELENFFEKTGKRKINSIFFGGGTPSLMPVSMVHKILEKINKIYTIEKDIEITLEANPTSVEAENFKALKEIGINRLSIGVQSFEPKDLKFLGREHSKESAIKAIELAQKYYNNFSFDLIYGRPKQKLYDWKKELEFALKFNSPHLSLYQLTIEKGTEFFKNVRDKKFQMPDSDFLSEFYDLTNEISSKYGFKNYEISNYAKPGYESKHNLNYWKYDDYIGIGAGAHSRVEINNKKKYFMTYHKPESWLENIKSKNHAFQTERYLKQNEILEELILMGLRIEAGIENKLFQKYFSKNITEIFTKKKLEILKEEGLIKDFEKNLAATFRGKSLLNSINNYLLN